MDTIDQFPADSPQAAELKKLIARRLESMGIGLPDDIMLELVITSINNGADANRIDQDLLYIFDEGDYDQDFSRWLFEEAVPAVLAPSRPHSRRSSMSQSKPSSRATSQERSDSRREKSDDKSRGRSRSGRDDDSTKERRRSSRDNEKDRGREREKDREHRREKDYDKYKDSERSREKSSKESDRSRRDRDKRESERGREKDREKDKHREKEKDKDRKSRHSSRSRSRSRTKNKDKESKGSRHREERDKKSRSDRDKDRRDRDRDRDRDQEKRKDRSRSRSPTRDGSRIDISEKQDSAKSAENTSNGVHQENEDNQLQPKKREESNDVQMDESADQKNGYHESRPNVDRPPPPHNAPTDPYADSAAPTAQHPMPPYQQPHHRGPPPGRFMRPPPPSNGRPHMPPGPPAANRYDGYHAGPGPSGNQYPATRPPPFRPPSHSQPGFNSQEAEPQPAAYVESEGPQSIPTFDEYPPAGHQAGAGSGNEMDWSYYGGEGYGYYDGYNYEDPYAYYGSEYDSAGYYPGYDQNYYAPQPDPHYAQPYPPRRKPFPFQRGAAPESSTATLLTLTPASEDTPRCRHWPFCHYDSAMGEQCKFWHPQTLCEKYPNCGNDDSSCRYIHPTYLHLKSNPTSNLYHTDLTVSLNKSNAGASIQEYSSDQASSNAIPTLSSSNDVPAYQLSIPCRMGKSCVRPNCKFLHPGQTPQNGNYSAPPNPALACKFGTFCTNPNCRYQHPSKSERFSNLGKSNDEAVEKIETGEGWGKEKTGDFVPLF